MQLEHSAGLQAVQRARDVEAAVVEFVGEAHHLDVERFRAGGSQAALNDEADNALVERVGLRMPQVALQVVALGRNHVEEIDAKHVVFVGQADYLRLLERHAVAFGQRGERAREALGEAEDALGLQNVGRVHGFGECVAVVVGLGSDTELAVHQETELVANVALADDRFSGFVTLKTELRRTGKRC